MAKKREAVLEAEAQPELPDMPAASPMGRAARALLSIRDKIEQVNEDMEKAEKDAKLKLRDLMDEAGKEVIVVDGITFRKVHKSASDDIRVLSKKSKRRKAKDESEEQE